MCSVWYYFGTILRRRKPSGADRGATDAVCKVEFPVEQTEEPSAGAYGHNVKPVDPILRNQRVLCDCNSSRFAMLPLICYNF